MEQMLASAEVHLGRLRTASYMSFFSETEFSAKDCWGPGTNLLPRRSHELRQIQGHVCRCCASAGPVPQWEWARPADPE